MMPAMGAIFALKGAKETDINTVQTAFDNICAKECFPEEFGIRKIIITESFDLTEHYDIGLDLSSEDRLNVVFNNSVEGFILYGLSDRSVLIEELVKIMCGYKLVDADYADYSHVFKKGCRFFWIEGRTDSIGERFRSLMKDVMKDKDQKNIDVFVQATDIDLAEFVNIKVDDDAYHSIVWQLLSTDSDENNCRIALFCAE